MGAKLDLKSIQCINIFSKITGVRTKDCFNYNNGIVFVVMPSLLPRALGEKGENVKRLGYMLRSRVKIMPASNIDNFVRMLVMPVRFKRLLVEEDGTITIIAGQQSKASLIGRDKVRVNELEKILKQYYNIKALKIV